MSTGYTLQLIVGLAGFLFVLILVNRLVQRFGLQQFSGEIQVLDRKGLSPSVALVLVELRGQQYLLSVSGKQVQLLDRVE